MSKFKTIKVKLKTIDKELDEIYRLLDTAQLTEVEIKEIQAMMVKVMIPYSFIIDLEKHTGKNNN